MLLSRVIDWSWSGQTTVGVHRKPSCPRIRLKSGVAGAFGCLERGIEQRGPT